MTTDTEQTQGEENPGLQERDNNLQEASSQIDERATLMQRARLMGMSVSNNIGLDTLRQRIQDKLDGKGEPSVTQTPVQMLSDPAVKLINKPTLRQYLLQDAMKLVRIHITNLDPKKKDLHGEIFTVANEFIGTIKKFVPYGEVTENGYHVPNVIYKMLKRRKFLNIRTRRNGANGQIVVEQGWAQEFSITVLLPLTEVELNQLATAQIASGSLN